MHRLAIAGIFVVMAVQTATADVADLVSTATWSFTSSGSNGFDIASALINETSFVNFNLGSIPVGATINSAALAVVNVSTNWNFGNNFGNPFGCGPFVGPLTFFGEATGCTDIFDPDQHIGAEYSDTIFVDGFAPNGTGSPSSIDLISVEGGLSPYSLDPSAITGGGMYSVPVDINASSTFGAFDDFSNGTPPIPSFSVDGSAELELVVNYSGGQSTSVTPEPASYSGLLTALLIPLAGVAIYKRRAARP